MTSYTIYQLTKQIAENARTTTLAKMLARWQVQRQLPTNEELRQNALIWTSHYAPVSIAHSLTNASELIGLNHLKLRGGSSHNTMNKRTHVSSLDNY